jgi:ABC-type multidrug transport system ATPase subunit
MDEPTAMLDPMGRREVMRAVRTLWQDLGLTVLYVTHHMEEVLQADRVVAMGEGRVVLEGPPAEVFTRVRELRALGLDVPAHLELALRLRGCGLELPEGLLGEDQLADCLLASWRRER